jgi:Flp pilus assembly secretin CpaC
MRAQETLVIAGLLDESAQKNNENVKWLSQMPILGPLFRSKTFINDTSELVILVTPQIYDASSVPNREGLETADAMQRHYHEIIGGGGLLE